MNEEPPPSAPTLHFSIVSLTQGRAPMGFKAVPADSICLHEPVTHLHTSSRPQTHHQNPKISYLCTARACASFPPFWNVNTSEDLEEAAVARGNCLAHNHRSAAPPFSSLPPPCRLPHITPNPRPPYFIPPITPQYDKSQPQACGAQVAGAGLVRGVVRNGATQGEGEGKIGWPGSIQSRGG
ncbi:hypothetical protein E2C01_057153 [Portunus trituberculatus]|uniref:Uncharacterized protein n=1 Tax=Portunus trituberculatus TaxID=210409 RepID=A0A5B7GS87_PORTR|nr:hypothetical protein [Portunus trituberculatus]